MRLLIVANTDKQEYYAGTMRMVDRAVENVAMKIDIYKREQKLQAAATKLCLRLSELYRECDDKAALDHSPIYREAQSIIYYAGGNPYTQIGIAKRNHADMLLKIAMSSQGWNQEMHDLQTSSRQAIDSVIALSTPPPELDEPTTPHADAQHTDILASILPSRPPAI